MTQKASEGTFLTDREESEMRVRRADFVREVLKPATFLYEILQNDTKSLDDQVNREIVDGIREIRAAMELRIRVAEEEMRGKEEELEQIERDLENNDLVVGLKREIKHYSDSTVTMMRQEKRLESQEVKQQAEYERLQEDIRAKRAILREIHRENVKLHREIESNRTVKRIEVPKLPLMKLFKEVPFEVFTSLSSRDVGHLSISQIKVYIEYKNHVKALKSLLNRISAQVKLHQFTNFLNQTQLTPSDIFIIFLRSYGNSEPAMPRSLSTTRLLNPSPHIEFQTLAASRLFSIEKHRERSLTKQRNALYVTRKELGEMRTERVIGVLREREGVVERLRYFIGHGNVFGMRESERSTLCDTKRSGN